MSLWQAILLGLVQGLTEFLPVSSSGHLALGKVLIGLEDIDPFFDVLVHCATLLVVVGFFRGQIAEAVRGLLRFVAQPNRDAISKDEGLRMALYVALATIPTGVVGLLLKDFFEGAGRSLGLVGACFGITTLLLFSTRWLTRFRSGEGATILALPLWTAVALGFAQAMAILPGVSRSGTTIVAALWLGAHRQTSGEVSFLIPIPAIAGAALLTVGDGLDSGLGAGVLIAGSAAAALSGGFALTVLMRFVRRGGLAAFGWYTLSIMLLSLYLTQIH